MLDKMYLNRIVARIHYVRLGKVLFALVISMSLSMSDVGGQSLAQMSEVKLHKFNYSKPLFNLDSDQASNLGRHLRFSSLTGYREGVKVTKSLGNFQSHIDKEHGTIRFYMYNLPIVDLVSFGLARTNRLFLQVSNSDDYRYRVDLGPKQDWLRKHSYCFEYLMPIGTMRNIDILKKELAQYFDISFGFEKRMMDALVLVSIKKNKKIISRRNLTPKYKDGRLTNSNISDLAILFEESNLPPLINETGIIDLVDLDISKANLNNVKSIKQALNKYGLDIRNEKRLIDVFVIKENNYGK